MRPRSSSRPDFPCRRARTKRWRFHRLLRSVLPAAKTIAMPSRARRARRTILPPADDWPGMAQDSRSAARPATPLLSSPVFASLPVRFRRFRWPTSYSSVPATARSELSVPMSGWCIAPTSCRSGLLGSHPLPPPAARTTRPTAVPLALPCLARDKDPPPSAGHCHFADHFQGFADIPPGRQRSYPSAKVSPLFLRGGPLRHD